MTGIHSDPLAALRKNSDPLAIKVCKNCNSIVSPKAAGSGWIELVLWCFMIVPGLIYTIWRRGQRGKDVCTVCKAPHMIPLASPAGLEIGKKNLSKQELTEFMSALEKKQRKTTQQHASKLAFLKNGINRHPYLTVFTVVCVIGAFLSEPSAPVQIDSAGQKQADLVKANMICAAAHSTDEGLKYRVMCTVDEANRIINIRMDTSILEAKKICWYTAEEAHKNGIDFNKAWTLKILPPLKSGSNPLMTCKI